jgi:hypothetical protein
LGQNAPPKTHNRSFKVENGKHDAVTESVVAVAVSILDCQSGLHQQVFLYFRSVAGKGAVQVLPPRGGITNAEMGSGLACQATLPKIGNRAF